MKKQLTALSFLLFSVPGLAQEISTDYKEYSYTELFEMIADTQDSVFSLKNAVVKYDLETDSLFGVEKMAGPSNRKETLVIDKELYFDDVHFQNHIFRGKDKNSGYFGNMHFKKRVTLMNSTSIAIIDCVFDDLLLLRGSGEFCSTVNEVERNYGVKDHISVQNSIFYNGFRLFYNCNFQDDNLKTTVNFINNEFYPNIDDNFSLRVTGNKIGDFVFMLNKFPVSSFVIINNDASGIFAYSNDFGQSVVMLMYDNSASEGKFYIYDNNFEERVILGLPLLNQNHELPLSQFKKGISNYKAYQSYKLHVWKETGSRNFFNKYSMHEMASSDSVQNDFNVRKYEWESVYENESAELGKLRNYYLSRHNIKSANEIYVQLKDLETQRFRFEYHENPSFKTFFTFKINQFLGIFSTYGTEPARAIVFSMYVILCFALIYLFFPNHWDSHGRTRIMDRYRFFLKYLNRNEGASEVYREEKEKELMSFHEFREYLEKHGKTAPRFFYATAIPLYKWSISGSQLTGWILSKIDVLNGTWENTPKSQRRLKSSLVIGAFLIALIYDLFIKILNAMMLSINTFTTLGFGEIPIKGLPRYLAIVQGFIGWFMLTIFTISLISQLLN